jgi:WD40-like Beta Propeller Repeat
MLKANEQIEPRYALRSIKSLFVYLIEGPGKFRTPSLVLVAAALIFASIASAKHLTGWGVAVNAELIPGTSSEFNTPFNDGCPIQAPDGLSFFMASNRPGGFGGQDIWVSRRLNTDEPWGAPENLGMPVNSDVDDFCPSPVRGHGLFFVSARAGGCGGPDIYFTRQKHGVWEAPQNLGCHINSSSGEASPSYFEDESGQAILYFSSTRPGGFEPGGVDSDIYYSLEFGTAQLAPVLNTAFDDSRPNVRKDGREVVFDSNRAGGLGGTDILSSSRESIADEWLPPVNLGAAINSSANETRASLSWDGRQLVFGSNRPGVEGSTDIFVSTREKIRGSALRRTTAPPAYLGRSLP